MAELKRFRHVQQAEMSRDRDFHQYAGEFGMTSPDFEEWLENQRALDVGSAKGKFVTQARGKGHDVIGMDIDPRGGRGVVVQAEGSKMPFADEIFTRVTLCNSLLMYASNKKQLREDSRELHRVLQQGGRVLTTLVAEGLDPVNATEFRISLPDRTGIFSANVPEIMEQAGFKEVRRTALNTGKNMIAVEYERI